MRTLFIAIFAALAATSFGGAVSDQPLWITGEVFAKDGLVFFRADEPIKNNSTANVVFVGPTKDGAELMGSILMRAAERHVKARFYGVLMPVSIAPPGHHERLPSLQFIVWKMHAPTDPDELPPGEGIHPDPHQPLPGYRVTIPPK